jgi:hypothetical protein
MKFALSSGHRDFFHKHRLIEFDDLIPPTQAKKLNESVDKALADKLEISAYQIKNQNSQTLFDAGRDLWRVNTQVKNSILDSQLAGIASELIHLRPLRFGYDQYLQGVDPSRQLQEKQDAYNILLTESQRLDQASCLTGVACGLMICLACPKDIAPSQQETPEQEISENLYSVFPKKAGSGTYFAPDFPINYPILTTLQGYRYLLIVYVQSFSQYYLEERDLHTHELKGDGYVFGDKLNDKRHPIVLR